MRRNPLSDLDELPDDPKLGLRLTIAGLVLLAVEYFWSRFSPTSFHQVSAIFLTCFGWLGAGHGRARQPLTLTAALVLAGVICIISGVYIFFRRSVWHLQDRRADDIVRLDLK